MKKCFAIFFFIFIGVSIYIPQTIFAQSCTDNSNCSTGYYCNQNAGQCLPQPGSNNPPPFNVNQGPTNATFEAVDPLVIGGSPYATAFASPGGILSRVLVFAFPIAGLLLFSMIVWGGFEILAGAHDKKSMDAGRQRVTAAIVGFLLLFSSYWIAQIVEYIFGITIL